MKIAVIGGGAAGLVSAWLLEAEHEVTLYERDDRLGGHAHTVDIEVDGVTVHVDAGFQFFGSGAAYATFNRLLDALGVARESYPATLTVYRDDGGPQHPVVLPPFRGGRPVWSALTPRALADSLRFRRFLAGVPAFLEEHDTSITISEYIDRQRLPTSFVERFLYPAMLGFWCVELDDFRQFAAYNALYYLGANLPTGLRPPAQSEIAGGLRVYVDALASDLTRTDVMLGAGVCDIQRLGDGYRVQDARGEARVFDQIVVATNAAQALALIHQLPDQRPVAEQLARFEYFDTTIAIHGDTRLMPRKRSAWSVVNSRWSGHHSSLSVWSPASGRDIFKSWVTWDEHPPHPLYATATYQHGKITVDYFDAQRRLTALQGRSGVWLAGLYTHDADSHESAIQSAITIARDLAPQSTRLALLESADGATPRG